MKICKKNLAKICPKIRSRNLQCLVGLGKAAFQQFKFQTQGGHRAPPRYRRTVKGLIFAELNFRGINFREFRASNSRKLIPQNSLKMTNSRKLIPRKINSITYFPKILQIWQKEQVNHKNGFANFSKFAKIDSANFSKMANSRKLIPRKINSAKINSANINSAKINSAKINPFKVVITFHTTIFTLF